MDGRQILNYAVRISIGLVGVLLNMLQMMLFSVRRRASLSFEVTLLSLSVADFVVSLLVCVAYSLFLLYFYDKIDLPLKEIVILNAVGTHLSVTSSMLHLTFIAFQRLFVVLSPFRFNQNISKTLTSIIICVVWLLSGIYIFLVVLNHYHIYIPLSWLIMICAAALVFCYTAICYRLLKVPYQDSNGALKNRRRTVTLYCLIVTSAFLVCSLPFAASSFWKTSLHRDFRMISDWLLVLNCAIDPTIYLAYEFIRGGMPPLFSRLWKTHRVAANGNA